MKETVVLYPGFGFTHMASMVELGKLILHHHPHISITVLVTTSMPSDIPSTISTYINHISQTNLPISFFTLPSISPPQQPNQHNSPNPPTPMALAFELVRLNSPNIVQALETMSLTSNILALITTAAAQVSYHPHIPTYYYFTSGATAMAAILYLPTLDNQITESFKDLGDTLINVPGLPPIKASHFPPPMLDRHEQAYSDFLQFGASLPTFKGIISNTFDLLEPNAIKAIKDGACVTNCETLPLHCIGPLVVDAKYRAVGTSYDEDCLSWLNLQPSKSVVFLCFGRMGAFSAAQLMEIAIGLEKSEERFLWVVRNPPPNSNTEPNLEELLPQGFLERTKGRGLVLKSWAPQGDVLRHESVGGFVTHCGWNSVTEAVSYGVPMVAWPLYSEQHMNGVVLVEEMKLALAIGKLEKEQVVKSEVVEKKVRELMRLEEGKDVRERSVEMKAMAKAAWSDGGSSLTAFSNLVASWKQG